ncbi:MAG: SufE family protein [Devosiaceae bacterium]|nr:SufE family protein [Devosiaceae bacterium MH13]
MADFSEIEDNFEFLGDWEDRYRYVIELGRSLEPLSDDERNDQTKVLGCASQVWLVRAFDDDGSLHFRGDSDAHIVRGLVAIVLALYNGRQPSEALEIDAQASLAGLGLDEHLSPQRSNGLKAMLERIRADAAASAAS